MALTDRSAIADLLEGNSQAGRATERGVPMNIFRPHRHGHQQASLLHFARFLRAERRRDGVRKL